MARAQSTNHFSMTQEGYLLAVSYLQETGRREDYDFKVDGYSTVAYANYLWDKEHDRG